MCLFSCSMLIRVVFDYRSLNCGSASQTRTYRLMVVLDPRLLEPAHVLVGLSVCCSARV